MIGEFLFFTTAPPGWRAQFHDPADRDQIDMAVAGWIARRDHTADEVQIVAAVAWPDGQVRAVDEIAEKHKIELEAVLGPGEDVW